MFGFTAEYESGEITPDGVEIAEAGWFGRDDLPPIPSRVSIARRMIETPFLPLFIFDMISDSCASAGRNP